MTKYLDLTQDEVRDIFFYDPLVGIFIRRKVSKFRPEYLGTFADCNSKTGYKCVSVRHKYYLSHRVAWLYTYGYWPELIDHIDQNKHNNRIDNLRECTRAENVWNMPLPHNNTSGVKGASWSKKSNSWIATISVNRKTTYLGKFPTKELAGEAYEAAVNKYRGHFLEIGK